MSITAAFDKVLFFNSASKYCVLRMKTADIMIPQEARSPFTYRDHLIRFTAVGYDLPQTAAVNLNLDGVWEKGKYGVQLQVENWSEIIPPTIEGIRAYLSSGLLKGIGEKTAEAIVQRFGMKSLEIIEKRPEKLLEIRGITEERLEEIKAGYAESKVLRDLLTILAPFKVTPNTAMKIYEHFGPGGVSLLRESPFRLCQVAGFGFLRVDAIVQKSGGDPHDPMRVQGALFYALEQSRSNGGHLFVEAEKLIKEALQLLNEKIPLPKNWLDAAQVEKELTNMILTNVVVSNKGNIYLPHVFAQENESACKAVQMLMEIPEPVNLTAPMAHIKGQLGITLSAKQNEAVEMVFRHNLSIITGGPGTGKSTILKAVIELYRYLYPNKTIALGAPTGKASRRMAETTGMGNAQTIHAILGLHGEDAGWKQKKPLDVDFVIVDESSMMDMWLTHQLLLRLKAGTKMLLVGDADQLESVGAGDVLQELIDSGLVPVTVLDEIFRQAKDSMVAYNAKFIKDGKTDLYYGSDFSFIEADTQAEVAEIIRDVYKKETERVGIGQVQILSPFREEGEASADALNEAIRSEVNPPSKDKPEVMFGGRLFRVHDRVMQTRNNYDIHLHNRQGDLVATCVFNGDIGTVRKIGAGIVTIDYDGRFAEYPLESLGELTLAYAQTVHKGQGSEYNTVIMPMLTAHRILLTRNLFRTAITRAKQRVILVGQKKAMFMAIHRSRKGKRNTLLGERMRLYYQALSQKSPADKELKNVS